MRSNREKQFPCSVFPAAALRIALGAALPLCAAELHVSPAGDDGNPGTATRPVATLQRAQRVARASAGREDVAVIIHGGTYELAAPLVFEAPDSGTADKPVVWTTAGDERVVISGGRKLRLDWRPHRDGIVKAAVPADCPVIDQLLVGGERRSLARWPDFKAGLHGVDAGYGKGLSPVAGTPFSKVDPPVQDYAAFRYDSHPFTPRDWADPATAILHVFQAKGWGNMQWRLTGVDRQQQLLQLGEGGWQVGTLWDRKRANIVSPNSRFFIENVFEELDAPGEWFFDGKLRTLFYHPVTGENMRAAEVVACGLKELIVVKGTAEKPVRHIHWSKLVFSHTARTILDPYETRLRGDWAIARRAAMRFEGAAHCSVADCEFVGLGGNGVLLTRLPLLDGFLDADR